VSGEAKVITMICVFVGLCLLAAVFEHFTNHNAGFFAGGMSAYTFFRLWPRFILPTPSEQEASDE
jgi:hypothetical protein